MYYVTCWALYYKGTKEYRSHFLVKHRKTFSTDIFTIILRASQRQVAKHCEAVCLPSSQGNLNCRLTANISKGNNHALS